jgi:hypothetical protein
VLLLMGMVEENIRDLRRNRFPNLWFSGEEMHLGRLVVRFRVCAARF